MAAEQCFSEQISERICEHIADVHVLQVVEQVLEAPKTSSQDRNLLGKVEQIPDVLASEMVEQLVKLPKTVSENNPGADCGAYCGRLSSPGGCRGTGGDLQSVSQRQDSTAFCGQRSQPCKHVSNKAFFLGTLRVASVAFDGEITVGEECAVRCKF